MRRSNKTILSLVVSIILLASAGMSYASVVTVDIAAKTAKSDVETLGTKGLRIKDDQIGIFVQSTMLAPQMFTLKINGLTASDYDVYVNHEFRYTKPAKELEAGVQYTIDGRVVDDCMMRCVNTAKDSIAAVNVKMQASKDTEAKRIGYTLNQAADWCRGAIMRDQAWRSVSVILVPTGKMLESMTWLSRDSDIDTARTVTRACWLLQQARDRMGRVIKDPTLRNDAVVALTPVSFSAIYSAKNGKPHIDATLLNNCDLPVSGDVSMALPAGWKTTAKTLKFADVKCGDTFRLSFDLIAPSKTAAAPDSVPIAANVTLVQDTLTASCKLKVIAKAEPK